MPLTAAAVALPSFSVHLAAISALRPLVSPPSRFSHCILRGTKPTRRRRPPRHPPRCSASTSVADVGEEITRSKLIWRAVKLPIYSVALVPLTVGSSAAYLQTGIFFARRYAVLLVASVLIITWLNLSNDVYDFDTGADRNKKESVVNIIGSRGIAHFMANISLLLGFMGLIWACTNAGDIRSMILLTLAIMCGYVYQCPPFRLSYQGLGEPLCFSAFGPFATTAFFLSQNSRISSATWYLEPTMKVIASSILVGLTTTLILFCSHFHQIDGDLAVGKMSPLVRIGTKSGSDVVRMGIVLIYLLVVAFGLCKALPSACSLLCLLTLPVGKLVADYVKEHSNDNTKIFMAKYYCVRLHTAFGAALSIGMILARRWS